MDSLKVILGNCGPIGYVLLGSLCIALWIFLERFFYYHRCQVNVEGFLHGLFNIVRNNKIVEAVAICDSKPTPVSAVVRAVITHYDKGDSVLRQATDEAAMTELPRLEKGVKLMAGIGNVAPILGLLGTLLSLMEIFSQVKDTGNFTPMAELIGPVMNALFTTALGLIVAIAVHCFYFILTECIATIVGDMEKAASEMTYFMLTKEWKNAPTKTSLDIPTADAHAATEEKSHDSLEK